MIEHNSTSNLANPASNLATKGFVVLALSFFLILPSLFILGLIEERQSRQKTVSSEISAKWANKQTLTGPILTIPYLENNKANPKSTSKKYLHILPENLTINGDVNPEIRSRGIFDVILYNSKLKFSGNFPQINSYAYGIDPANLLYDQAYISVGISDLRGIKESVVFNYENNNYKFNPGTNCQDILEQGISTNIKYDNDVSLKKQFEMSLNLNGSEYIYFTPIGKETNVKITSTWASPSFDGAYLPDSRSINSSGFDASWKILNLNRNYPQVWINDQYKMSNSNFGINLSKSIDNYAQTARTVKYAFLIIILTFIIFYFLEIKNKTFIHPMQYILVACALLMFYLLLVSLSEQLSFLNSYLIASVMTISLIAMYTRSILKETKLSILISSCLIILYSFIYTIIQMEDYSLLMGSMGLFVILALIMFFSRKFDWQAFSIQNKKDKNPYIYSQYKASENPFKDQAK